MATEPLVSVVTPAYNEAAYLPECIESVLRQTYQNWEYTIVDNQSSDGSPEIAARYAARDRRIRVTRNTEFLPVIPNHNAALRQISSVSKYCKMVFADDWIFPECLEKMVAAAEDSPEVAMVSAYVLEGDRVILTGLPYETKVASGREICRRHLLEDLYVFGSANSVLYRADLVRLHDPFFNEANIHADTEACFALLKNTDFAFVHQVLSYSRVRIGSLTSISQGMQTNWAGMLKILSTHGRVYLRAAELQDCVDRQLSDYYRYLGKCLFVRPRDGRFWRWHDRALKEAGISFNRVRVLRGAAAQICDAVLNPKQSLARLKSSGARRRHIHGAWSEEAAASVEHTVA